MRLLGRRKIFSDVKTIDETNIIEVLKKAYAIHRQNMIDIQFLIDYERGIQPLQRIKTIRGDIDIRVNSSLPNYIKRFKIGYNWGAPIMLVQRGNNELHGTNADDDDLGISSLNELLKNIENIGYKDQNMAEFLEVCGIGHRMIDIKTDFPSKAGQPYTGSLVEIYTLDSRYAFCVYYNGPGQKKLMGVTFSKSRGKLKFTCFTEKNRFDIESWEIVNKQINPLGKVSIVEYERSHDRTGCFERKIQAIDELNILESDFANDSAQRVQEMFWGNDIDLPTDETTGEPETPQSGQWVLTSSSEGKNPKIQPLSGTFDGTGALNAIVNSRITILQDCYVPIQYSNSGGGSTGIAVDMSSGWSAAELDAQIEQQMTEKGKREELELILRAIQLVPKEMLPSGSPIRNLHVSDIEFRFLRSRNYDLSIKANTFATYFNCGVHPRHILQVIDAFPDTEQTYIDSKPMFDALQAKMIGSESTENETYNTAEDPLNQISQSPILEGLNMGTQEN